MATRVPLYHRVDWTTQPDSVDLIDGCANLRSDDVHNVGVERPGRNRLDVKKSLPHSVHAVRVGRLDEPIGRVNGEVNVDEFLKAGDGLVARQAQDDERLLGWPGRCGHGAFSPVVAPRSLGRWTPVRRGVDGFPPASRLSVQRPPQGGVRVQVRGGGECGVGDHDEHLVREVVEE